MANENNKRKKKSGGSWLWLVFILIGLMSQMSESSGFQQFFRQLGRLDSETVFAVVLPVVMLVFLVAIIRTVARAAQGQKTAAPEKPHRHSAAASREFPVPEAHCVVCETTGEDHFARDKALRIRQLDEWLKNGLIDRAEYKVLKERYEQDL